MLRGIRSKKLVNKVFFITLTLLIINIRNYEFSNCYAASTPLNDPITSSDVLLDEILSFKDFDQKIELINDSFNRNTISQLLWAAQGITHYPFRSVPSAGGTYPLDVYFSSNVSNDNIERGTYRYEPSDHSLEIQAAQPTFKTIIESFSGSDLEEKKKLVENAPVLYLVTAEYERTTTKYGSRGIGYVHLEAGHLLQNLRIQAKAISVKLEIVLDFDAIDLQTIFDIEYEPLAIVFAWETNLTTDNYLSKHLKLGLKDVSMDIKYSLIPPATSVEEAIQGRKSIRDYLPVSIDELEVSYLHNYCIGRIDSLVDDFVFDTFFDKWSINAYTSLNNVSGMEEGMYHYDIVEQSFNQISNDSRNEDLWDASLQQPWVLDASMVIVLTINETMFTEGNNTYTVNKQRALFDVGAIAQNLYLSCYALNLGMVVIGAFDDSNIRYIVSATAEERPVYVISVGKIEVSDGVSETIIQNLGDVFAWLAIAALYTAHIFTVPHLKKKIRRKNRIRLHVGFISLSICSVLVHLFLDHGGWSIVENPSRISFWAFISSTLLNFSMGGNVNLYNITMNIARIILWLSPIYLGLSVWLLVKKTKTSKRRILKNIHKYFGYLMIIVLLMHISVNGHWISNLLPWSLIILISAILSYVFLLIYPQIKKNGTK